MGRYGGAILTIFGAVVGTLFGFPALGAALGSIAGSLLFPTKLPTISGPRLGDLAATSASVGAPIPRVWGTIAVGGTVIHQSNLRETINSEEVGGKGGPTQTVETPVYSQDFAIALCDCPDNPIAGVRRIWANGKPIYDKMPQRSGESNESFSARLAANNQLENQMTIYLGTDTQLPDPTLEAFYGVGEVSAHLQLAYVVFTDWQNKAEDGNRMPAQWKFEIFTDGSVNSNSATEYANEVLFPWKLTSEANEPINPKNQHEFQCTGNGQYLCAVGIFDSLPEVLEIMAENRTALPFRSDASPSNYVGYSFNHDIPDILDTMGGPSIAGHDALTVFLHYTDPKPSRVGFNPAPGAGTCTRVNQWFAGEDKSPIVTNDFGTFETNSYFRVAALTPFLPGTLEPGAGWEDLISGCAIEIVTSESFDVQCSRSVRAPDDPCHPRGGGAEAVPGSADYCIVGGIVQRAGPYTLVSGGAFRVLAVFSTETVDGIQCVKQYPLNPVRPSTSPDYLSQPFWEAAYENAVALGKMPSGLAYGVDYPIFRMSAYQRTVSGDTIDTPPVLLTDIVRDLCRESGFLDADIDVADLAGLTVVGYSRTRVMTCRAALDPLRQAKFFDGFESGRHIKFQRRGHAIVRTFIDDELGCQVVSGESGTDVSKVTTKKAQDIDLPRSVRVHYISQSRDYEPGEQLSPARLQTGAINDVDLELPIVMTDTEAKQIAQVLWADAWASRWSHEIVIDCGFQGLEPTDCIGVPVDGFVQRCRITEITDSLPACRKVSLVRDDDGSYESFAVAQVPPYVPQNPRLFSPSEMIALDIPLLRDEDNSPGFYVATRALIRDTYAGTSVFRSMDGGGSFVKVVSIANAAVIGTLLENVAGTADYAVLDGETSFLVQLDSGSLDSITYAAMLAGGAGSNAAAIGADGRWEIIQFQDAELVSDDIYRIRTLLRGRRGTEQNMGQAFIADRFVLLTGPGIVRVPLQLLDLNREYLYRPVATGINVDAVTSVPFTCRGVCLKPFYPCFIRGTRDPATALWALTWIRRGRIGQTLPGGTDIPISETVEDYELEILRADGTPIRVISVSSPGATYDLAQQISDFGSAQDVLTVNVYQMSEAVGRGYPGAATLFAAGPLL